MDNTKDDKCYSQIWAVNKVTRIRAERRCDYIIAQLALPSGGKILEIVCGLVRMAGLSRERIRIEEMVVVPANLVNPRYLSFSQAESRIVGNQ